MFMQILLSADSIVFRSGLNTTCEALCSIHFLVAFKLHACIKNIDVNCCSEK